MLSILLLTLLEADALAANPSHCYPAEKIKFGINIGHYLEEAEPKVAFTDNDFRHISTGHFDTIRLPVAWIRPSEDPTGWQSANVKLLDRLHRDLEKADNLCLNVIISAHNMEREVSGELQGFDENLTSDMTQVWIQISESFQNSKDYKNSHVYFELFNEPSEQFDCECNERLGCDMLEFKRRCQESEQRLAVLYHQLAETIWAKLPEQRLIIGGARYNSIATLSTFDIDSIESERDFSNDDRIYYTFHYYIPAPFTHQGADWGDGKYKRFNRSWPEDHYDDHRQIRNDFCSLIYRDARWLTLAESGRLLMTEFGVIRPQAEDRENPTVEATQAWIREVIRNVKFVLPGMGYAYMDYNSPTYGIKDNWKEILSELLYESPSAYQPTGLEFCTTFLQKY